MSVIIGYYGKNGAVIAGDKRNLLINGIESDREKLEELLYSGKIKTDDELLKKASEFGVNVHINDSQEKVRKIGNLLCGEVRSIGKDSKRRRMYLSKEKCTIIDLENNNIINKSTRTGSGIVVFGNKYIKHLVESEIKKHVQKLLKMNAGEIKSLFEKILKNIKNATLSDNFEYYFIENDESNFENTINDDLENLFNYRNELSVKMVEMQRVMAIAEKIAKIGDVGVIKNENLVLYDEFLAIDKICPEPVIYSEIIITGEFIEGDIVTIDNESLKVKRTGKPVVVEKIICKRE
ncbi:MJ0548 connectase family domain-containing protein [Methanococcus sp. CF]